MPLSKPYPHIYRHGPSSVTVPYYKAWKSDVGINCLSTYEILKQDLKSVFEYIEPHTNNLGTFSHRTFELLVRACIEVEALCKLVFLKNCITLNRYANIIRYSDLNGAMRLSDYEVLCYGFQHPPFVPFASFSNSVRQNRSPAWYQAYNRVKHNRTDNFSDASLENVIQAIGAVYVLVVAQFGLGFDHKMQLSYSVGHFLDCPDIFRVRELPQWSDDEQYQFDWEFLKSSPHPYSFHPLLEIP